MEAECSTSMLQSSVPTGTESNDGDDDDDDDDDDNHDQH